MRRRTNDGQQLGQELVRQDEDQQRGVATRFRQVGHRPDVTGQWNSRQVLDVLVAGVDDLREFLLGTVVVHLHFLFVDPHVDMVFAKWQALAVGTHQGSNGASPVATANDTDLEEVTAGLRVEVDRRKVLRGGSPSMGCRIVTGVHRAVLVCRRRSEGEKLGGVGGGCVAEDFLTAEEPKQEYSDGMMDDGVGCEDRWTKQEMTRDHSENPS